MKPLSDRKWLPQLVHHYLGGQLHVAVRECQIKMGIDARKPLFGGADQPAYTRSLISAFVIRLSKFATFLASFLKLSRLV